ncbi:Suppressor of Sensor Kinase (SLN1) [Savitreella phatthalungensis]
MDGKVRFHEPGAEQTVLAGQSMEDLSLRPRRRSSASIVKRDSSASVAHGNSKNDHGNGFGQESGTGAFELRNSAEGDINNRDQRAWELRNAIEENPVHFVHTALSPRPSLAGPLDSNSTLSSFTSRSESASPGELTPRSSSQDLRTSYSTGSLFRSGRQASFNSGRQTPSPRPSIDASGRPSYASTRSTRSSYAGRIAYQAQERAYVQKLQNEPGDDYYAAGLGKNDLQADDGEEEDEDDLLGGDELDAFAGSYEEMDMRVQSPTDDYMSSISHALQEDLAHPQNRARLEWLTMLASVLTGDVVRSEKKRISGTVGTIDEGQAMSEIWYGLRAKLARRSLANQKRIFQDARAALDPILESVTKFQIRGRDVTSLTPREQVSEILDQIDRCENLFPSHAQMVAAKPIVATELFIKNFSALTSWHSVTNAIHTQLTILRKWTGNDELDITQPGSNTDESAPGTGLNEESFIERVLKENGLETLFQKRSLGNIDLMMVRAKTTVIENSTTFAAMHLPAYLDELLLLINFPTKLIEEALRLRLVFAKRLEDPTMVMVDQMIEDFVRLLEVAVAIKKQYMKTTAPEPGWQLPPCIDENFDSVVLQAIEFYFRLLHWKLGSDAQNHFKEAEILEQEYDFLDRMAQYIEGGATLVAEQFTTLTYKLIHRVLQAFREGLAGPPTRTSSEMHKHFSQLLENTRLRHRKLLRFSKSLSMRFENSTEYLVDNVRAWTDLVAVLADTSHVFAYTASVEQDGMYIIVDPSLAAKPELIRDILRTCARPTSSQEQDLDADLYGQYVLVMSPPETLSWPGQVMEISVPETSFDILPGRIWLVSDGSPKHLQAANLTFSQLCGDLVSVGVQRRSHLTRVNRELRKIHRVSYRLSTAIMDSVATIREVVKGLGNEELVQTSFSFATEFGQRALRFMDRRLRSQHNIKLIHMAIDWVSFICDDCDPVDRRTFKWTVVALEFAMMMSRGRNILVVPDEAFNRLRSKVARCMTLLISHFDIMGARSAAQSEREKKEDDNGNDKFEELYDSQGRPIDQDMIGKVREGLLNKLDELETKRKQHQQELQMAGKVLDDTISENRSLMYLASSLSNITMRWQQGRFIGSGTFGSVYQGVNLDTGELMAVKEIRLQDPHSISGIVKSIKDEMTVLEMLNHPNIVTYYGVEVHRDKVYIFMELCQGGSLASQLEHGRIAEETVVQVYTLQMLEGLAHLHERGIVHRDIKPENVLLDHNGVIKYTDFGAAKVIAKRGKTKALAQTKANSMTGTPMYMSPEIIKGDGKGRQGAMDIWALGCCVLEMATGQRPWSHLDNEFAIMYHIAGGHSPAMPSHDQLSEKGQEFLERCFTVDPLTRASAVELLNDPWMIDIRQNTGMASTFERQLTISSSSSTAPGTSSGQLTGMSTGSTIIGEGTGRISIGTSTGSVMTTPVLKEESSNETVTDQTDGDTTVRLDQK